MNDNSELYPIVDLHCDMLLYLIKGKNANPSFKEDIGCAIPYLIDGNVKIQVMALYSDTNSTGYIKLLNQLNQFNRLLKSKKNLFSLIPEKGDINHILYSNKISLILSIENASGLCNEDENLENAFERIDFINNVFSKIIYISLTHFGENRFGGGSTTKIGLKDDGKRLLIYINGKGIAIDLSHCSDALAYDILDYINKESLNVHVIVSHSNFRAVYRHARNLPDELAKEVIRRKGIIGINFLRAFVHHEKPEMLLEHIKYGFQLDGEKSICFGADFFYTKDHPDQNRVPFFFKEHENASKYQLVLNSLKKTLNEEEIKALAFKNALEFISRIWK